VPRRFISDSKLISRGDWECGVLGVQGMVGVYIVDGRAGSVIEKPVGKPE
jgi:hypothetical protein